MRLRLGTRGSDLALAQSRWIAGKLAADGFTCELVVISTSGDRSSAPSFGAIGPQGVFVREIEQALLDGEIDFAVHSYKDLPTESADGLVVAATPARRDPADWLVCRRECAAPGDTLLPLARGARVGTSSARRQAWLRHFRPDLKLEPLRGNVPTRLRRLGEGDYDAIVLAGAGIERLDEASDLIAGTLGRLERHRLDPARFVPAPAQGALALQCRRDAAANGIAAALGTLADAAAARAVELERAALALAEGGCDAAFGARARPAGAGFELTVMAQRNGAVCRARVTGGGADGLAAQAMARLEALTGDAAVAGDVPSRGGARRGGDAD